jgi:hypothetical protein
VGMLAQAGVLLATRRERAAVPAAVR